MGKELCKLSTLMESLPFNNNYMTNLEKKLGYLRFNMGNSRIMCFVKGENYDEKITHDCYSERKELFVRPVAKNYLVSIMKENLEVYV